VATATRVHRIYPLTRSSEVLGPEHKAQERSIVNRPHPSYPDDSTLTRLLSTLDETASVFDLEHAIGVAARFAGVTPEYLLHAGPRGELSGFRQRRAWMLVADLVAERECTEPTPEDATS